MASRTRYHVFIAPGTPFSPLRLLIAHNSKYSVLTTPSTPCLPPQVLRAHNPKYSVLTHHKYTLVTTPSILCLPPQVLHSHAAQDYFTALLWKQLVGQRVLSSNYSSSDAKTMRSWDSHVWCSSASDGSVVISYINMQVGARCGFIFEIFSRII